MGVLAVAAAHGAALVLAAATASCAGNDTGAQGAWLKGGGAPFAATSGVAEVTIDPTTLASPATEVFAVLAPADQNGIAFSERRTFQLTDGEYSVTTRGGVAWGGFTVSGSGTQVVATKSLKWDDQTRNISFLKAELVQADCRLDHLSAPAAKGEVQFFLVLTTGAEGVVRLTQDTSLWLPRSLSPTTYGVRANGGPAYGTFDVGTSLSNATGGVSVVGSVVTFDRAKLCKIELSPAPLCSELSSVVSVSTNGEGCVLVSGAGGTFYLPKVESDQTWKVSSYGGGTVYGSFTTKLDSVSSASGAMKSTGSKIEFDPLKLCEVTVPPLTLPESMRIAQVLRIHDDTSGLAVLYDGEGFIRLPDNVRGQSYHISRYDVPSSTSGEWGEFSVVGLELESVSGGWARKDAHNLRIDRCGLPRVLVTPHKGKHVRVLGIGTWFGAPTELGLAPGAYTIEVGTQSELMSFTVNPCGQVELSGTPVPGVKVEAQDCGTPIPVRIGASISVKVGVPARFMGQPKSGVVEYLWDFGDGSTGSGQSIQHAYSKAGIYTVTLMVRTSSGRCAHATKRIAIRQK